MGKLALLELLDLVEQKRDEDPLLSYSTLLELFEFMNTNESYHRYIGLITSIQDSFSKSLSPNLLNRLPITLYRGQSVELQFEINLNIKDQLSFMLEDKKLLTKHQGSLVTCSLQPSNQQTIKLSCFLMNKLLSEYWIQFQAPVEMDDLGL
jgi:hypothetical protein